MMRNSCLSSNSNKLFTPYSISRIPACTQTHGLIAFVWVELDSRSPSQIAHWILVHGQPVYEMLQSRGEQRRGEERRGKGREGVEMR